MLKTQTFRVVLVGLVAAAALACGEAMGDMLAAAAGTGGTARAQTACSQWEVFNRTEVAACTTNSPCMVPAGWEPFATRPATS
jgi:hypothetical protein